MKKPTMKNHIAVRQIKTLPHLWKVLQRDKSIYVTNWCRVHPSAFFLAWQLRLAARWAESGVFWEIKPKKK